MGRARNHGGTGGHGCVPLPGERPNYNRHVMTDKTLLSLVSMNDGKKLLGPGVKGTHLRQQKVSDAEMPKLTSPKQQKTSAKQPVTAAKQQMAFVKQSVASAKEPLTSAQQPLTSVKQPWTSANKSVSSAKQQLTSASLPVSSAGQSPTSDNQPSPDQSLILADQQVTTVKQQVTLAKKQLASAKQLSVNHPATSAKQLVSSAKQHVTSGNQAPSSAKQPMTTDEKPLTSARQPVNSNKLPVDLVPNIVNSLEQEQQQTLFLDHPLFNLVKQPKISVQLPVTNKIETSTQYPETSDEQTERPVKQSMTSVNELVTFIPKPVMSPETTLPGQQQQQLTADQPLFPSVKQSVSQVKQPVISNLPNQKVCI